jgi:hypothetical protein
MAAKSFLRVVHKSIIFSDLVKALVYNGEEERVLGTDAAYWSKIRHEQGR